MQVNFFKWLNLPEVYEVDTARLQEAYYRLSKNTHPDNFHGKSDFEKQMAEKALGYTHQAYETLSCPIKRASYILLLNNIDLNSETIERQPMSADFLAKMFDWQMQDENQELQRDLHQNIQARLANISELFEQKKIELAVMPIREVMFMKKILEHT